MINVLQFYSGGPVPNKATLYEQLLEHRSQDPLVEPLIETMIRDGDSFVSDVFQPTTIPKGVLPLDAAMIKTNIAIITETLKQAPDTLVLSCIHNADRLEYSPRFKKYALELFPYISVEESLSPLFDIFFDQENSKDSYIEVFTLMAETALKCERMDILNFMFSIFDDFFTTEGGEEPNEK